MSPAQAITTIFDIISLLILARCLMSMLPLAGVQIDPYNPVVRFLIQSTDVFLEPFRRLIPPVSGIDFSPLVCILVLNVVQGVLVQLVS